MARTPLLQLSEVTIGFGGDPLLDGVDLVVQPGERIALVGRNGSGKSTLMRLMAGLVEADAGQRSVPAGISVNYMEQDPDFKRFSTLRDFVLQGFGSDQEYLLEAAAEGLGFDADAPAATASGGERRRAALARVLAQAPDLMLLDEPTNHLDIAAITWLEARLKAARAGLIIISHDRAILRELCPTTLRLDRGNLRKSDQPFDRFETWRDRVWAEQDQATHKLNRKIRAEGKWAVEGISARRKRNQGRLRALQAMRAERAAAIRRQGTAAMALDSGSKSGRMVIEANGVSVAHDDRTILRDFSYRIMRGDRIALVGPNGVGKTTLLNVLIGSQAPDSGSVRLGTNLRTAVFDQNRDSLNPDATLWEALTQDPEMSVQGRSDQVMVRGIARHVVGYLNDFLFDDAQARARVRSLTGGEKARLLLARIMARDANLLVLDEPTNDLDVETLDLLQELLGNFPGTVLIVSHDRDFLDRVAGVTLVFEGRGRVTAHAGGWAEYRATQIGQAVEKKPKKSGVQASGNRPAKSNGLTFTQRHRLAALPGEIDRLQADVSKLEAYLAAPDLFGREPAKFARASAALAERTAALGKAEQDWLDLAEKDNA